MPYEGAVAKEAWKEDPAQLIAALKHFEESKRLLRACGLYLMYHFIPQDFEGISAERPPTDAIVYPQRNVMP